MFRFDLLIRPDMTVRDVRQAHPSTAAIFARLGFRDVCDDCAIRVVARRSGLSEHDVVDALNRAVFAADGEGGSRS